MGNCDPNAKTLFTLFGHHGNNKSAPVSFIYDRKTCWPRLKHGLFARPDFPSR